MSTDCIGKVSVQIQKEINASMAYLAMGAHFAQDTVNRPGFSEFFFKAAGEEREHAQKLIEYLLMRGELQIVSNLISVNVSRNRLCEILTGVNLCFSNLQVPEIVSWESGLEALQDALRTEAEVTKSIKGVIKTCEDDNSGRSDASITKGTLNNDYHVS